MTPLVQQVYQIFAKHRVTLPWHEAGCLANCDTHEKPHWEPLVNDLVALLSSAAPPSRERLRGLFAKHHQAHDSAFGWREALMDDLMAWAAPRPIRKEELEQVLQKWFEEPQINPNTWKAELTERIWSWLSGQREAKPTWCSHCVWDAEGDFSTCSNPNYHKPHWCFQEAGMKPTPTRPNWTVCPICGAERPAEVSGQPRPAR